MNDHTKNVLQPLITLEEAATKIITDKGFNVQDFVIRGRGPDGLPHVMVVAEWDPDREAQPELVIIQQAETALTEQQEEAARQRLEQDVESARKSLEDDYGLGDKLKKKRGGFLD